METIMGVGFWKNKEIKNEDKEEYDLTQEPNFKFTNDVITYLIELPTRTLESAMAEYGKSKEELEELFLSVEWSSGHFPNKLVIAIAPIFHRE